MLKTKAAYSIKVSYDNDPRNPRHNDNNGEMVCWHRKYNLGDEHNYRNNDDFLIDMLASVLGNEKKAENKYYEVKNSLDNTNDIYKLNKGIIDFLKKSMVILPLYLYDHSGLAMSTKSFFGKAPHAEWDSGQVGWIYIDRDKFEKLYGEFNEKNIQTAIKDLTAEADLYGHYIAGENYSLAIFEDGEQIESIGGFTGEYDDVLKEMSEYAKDVLPSEKISSQEVDDMFGIDSPTIVTEVGYDDEFSYQLADEDAEMEL